MKPPNSEPPDQPGDGPEVSEPPRPRGGRLWGLAGALGVTAFIIHSMMPHEKTYVMPAHWNIEPPAAKEAAKAGREQPAPAEASSAAAPAVLAAASAAAPSTTVNLSAPMPAFAVPAPEAKTR